jgi:hypothetical protein
MALTQEAIAAGAMFGFTVIASILRDAGDDRHLASSENTACHSIPLQKSLQSGFRLRRHPVYDLGRTMENRDVLPT